MIFVFRTSVKNKLQVKKLKPHLDRILQEAAWNFDLEDCDKILRIDSKKNIMMPVINLLNRHQYSCEALQEK